MINEWQVLTNRGPMRVAAESQEEAEAIVRRDGHEVLTDAEYNRRFPPGQINVPSGTAHAMVHALTISGGGPNPQNVVKTPITDGLFKPRELFQTLQVKVPQYLWANITPIFYEKELQNYGLLTAPFLGSGILYEQMMESAPRHKDWARLSKLYLIGKTCLVCGGKFRLVAHHKIPFHERPDLEMDETNWAPLCEARPSMNCHISLGHYGNWTLSNPDVVEMCRVYNEGFKKARMR